MAVYVLSHDPSCAFGSDVSVDSLRRFLLPQREMRWAQVFVELVLPGILIALAVNEWMGQRRDAHAERQYLELLMREAIAAELARRSPG